MVTRIIDDAPKQQDEPPPPKPDMKTPDTEVPPIDVPDVAVDDTPPPEQPVATATNAVSDPSTAVPAQTDPKSPLTQPPYPPSSRRAGEEGSVALYLYVLPNGRVGEARVSKSSGFPALDESAMKEAKRAWKFVPVQQGGQAVAGWVTIAVTFKLTQ
jgi:protein TonB